LAFKGKIFLTGDFNSRVADTSDFVLNDENIENVKHILPHTYISDFHFSRKSQDKIINAQGRDLLDLCVSARLRILNGRFIGDILGNITCLNTNGCSVVDYSIVSQSLLSSVKYFEIKQPSYFSDHNQLVTHLKCDGKIPMINSNCKELDFEFKWSKVSKMLLGYELKDKNIYEAVAAYQEKNFENSTDGINNATESISNIYISIYLINV